jgi:hypothetical protein
MTAIWSRVPKSRDVPWYIAEDSVGHELRAVAIEKVKKAHER